MTSKAVIVSPRARDQIDQQVEFIAKSSLANAFAWQDRLMAAIAALADVQGHGVDYPVSARRGETVRKLVFERTYQIHYRVSEGRKVVEVINFQHGARQLRAGEP